MINPADVRKEIELQRRMVFQKTAEPDDLRRWNSKGMNAVHGAEILDCLPETLHDQSAIEGGSTLMTLQPDREASRPARGTS